VGKWRRNGPGDAQKSTRRHLCSALPFPVVAKPAKVECLPPRSFVYAVDPDGSGIDIS